MAKNWAFVSGGLNRLYFGVLALDLALLLFFSVIVATIALVSLVLLAEGNSSGRMLGAAVGFVLFGGAVTTLRIILITAEHFLFHALGFFGMTVFLAFVIRVAPPVLPVLLWGAAIVSTLAGLWILVSLFGCLPVPSEAGVRWFLIGAIVAILANLGASVFLGDVLRQDIDFRDAAQTTKFRLANLLLLSLSTAAHVLLLQFFRGIARFFGDDPTLDYVTEYLVRFLVIMGINAVLLLVVMFNTTSLLLVLIVSLLSMLLSIYLMLNFLLVVASARDIIRPYFRD